MIEQVRQLIARYARKGIIVDTNILLLYVVGLFDVNQIQKFKRTRKFSVEDFDTLLMVLKPFNKITTTPNVLTEVSNFLGSGFDRRSKTSVFQNFGESIGLMEEHYIDSRDAVKFASFIEVGLTDTGIFKLSKEKLVLTDDLDLTLYLQRNDIDVINFNNIRPRGWL